MGAKVYSLIWTIILVIIAIFIYFNVPASTALSADYNNWVYLDFDWSYTWLKITGFWDDFSQEDTIGGYLYEVHPAWNAFIIGIGVTWVVGLLCIWCIRKIPHIRENW